MPLSLASYERRIELPDDGIRTWKDLAEPIRLHRLGLALELERRQEVGANGVAHEAERAEPEQRLARCRRLLEPGSHVDGVPRDERLARASGHDLARVDADARLQPMLRDRTAHLIRRSNCSQCVVLVRDGNPENSHDGVSHELLHCSAVALEDDAEIVEVAPHPCPQRLRVGRLAESRRTDDVGEEDGDDLPHLA